MIKKYFKKISLFMSSILLLGTVSPTIVSAYENSSRNEIIEITEDTDYSKLNRAEWKDIDWSKYGGGGIENTELKKYLNSVDIDPLEDENYGLKLADVNRSKFNILKGRSNSDTRSVGDWSVGDTIQGFCDIQKSWMDGMGQSYFELGNFRDGLGGLEQVGLGWCMDNTAAEPPAGHTIVGVTATVISIDSVNGWVNFNVVVTPKDVTTGVVGGNGLLQGYQHVGANARLKVDVKGKLQISKKSSDPTITDGNNCYSLAGAEYTIYSDPNAVHAVAKVTMDSNGWAAPIELNAGVYYAMETKAPKGYALDTKVYQVEVVAGQTTSRTFTDRPKVDPIGILLRKVDANTGVNKPQGKGSLADAYFTLKFYSGEYTEGINPSDLGVLPTKTWVVKTDNDGYTELNDSYKVSGDDFWYNELGRPTMPSGTLTIQETKAPIGYKINPEIFIKKIVPGVSDNVSTYNEPIVKEEVIKGQVKVVKVDEETGEKLQGAEFELIDRLSGTVVETLITGADGSATSGLHPFAEYILKETKAPHKYTLNGQEHFITISEDMQVVEVTHQNRIIKGFVEIQKSDSEIDGLNIEGAVFGIFDTADNQVEELITDKNGYAKSSLHNWGDYTIRELKPAPGYLPTNTEWKVEIREEGKTYSYDIKNDIVKGRIQIVKIDSVHVEKPVAGATFNVVAQNVLGIAQETVVDTITTDENGFAFTKDLRHGDYYLEEISVGPDYWLNGNKYPISISKHEKIEVIRIKNDPVEMKLRVLKSDGEDNQPLSDVKFKVFSKTTGKDVEFTEFFGIIPYRKIVYTTNAKGEILFPQNLPYGQYQLIEVESREGYNPIAPIDFEITRDTNFEEIELLGMIHTMEVENTRIKGDFKLVKVDKETRTPLADVKFKVTCTEGFDKDKEWIETTDENGEINLKDLQYGKYVAEEVEPLWNYVTNTKKYKFEITEHGKTIELEVENEKIRGSVELLKVDEDTNRPLEGVEFELWNGEKLVGIYTTNKDGKIVVENLEAGNYYFREVKALDEYISSNESSYDFVVEKHGEVIKITATNKVKEGEVDFSKTDVSTGELIEGATIEIKGLDEQNKHIDFKFVSTKEETRFKLPVGKYMFKETIAPNGYVLNEEIGYFEIKENEIVKAEIKNKRIEGTLDFSKTDISTGEIIEGAKIKIECIEGFNKGQIIEFISRTEGDRFELEHGKYLISEVMPPEGYELTTEVSEFEIKEDGEVVKAELKNKRIEGILEFEKTDVSTGEVIEGANIKIECIEGFNKGQIIEFISSKEGNRFELEYGKYLISETMPPEGYELTTEVSEFEIKEDGEVVKAELKNKRIPQILPQTGGKAGSLVVIPGLIILVLGVLLFTRKRTNK